MKQQERETKKHGRNRKACYTRDYWGPLPNRSVRNPRFKLHQRAVEPQSLLHGSSSIGPFPPHACYFIVASHWKPCISYCITDNSHLSPHIANCGKLCSSWTRNRFCCCMQHHLYPVDKENESDDQKKSGSLREASQRPSITGAAQLFRTGLCVQLHGLCARRSVRCAANPLSASLMTANQKFSLRCLPAFLILLISSRCRKQAVSVQGPVVISSSSAAGSGRATHARFQKVIGTPPVY